MRSFVNSVRHRLSQLASARGNSRTLKDVGNLKLRPVHVRVPSPPLWMPITAPAISTC